ncbi:hypothetical protein NMY22_g7063 [Coprinellus aureogranulatus]|nr:hypothetical protein NMY22_g7063 [Coprinellus aureogranulatus]
MPRVQKERKRQDDPPKQRKPPRCSFCEDHPLKSQCIHTKAGRAYLASLGAATPAIETLSSQVPLGSLDATQVTQPTSPPSLMSEVAAFPHQHTSETPLPMVTQSTPTALELSMSLIDPQLRVEVPSISTPAEESLPSNTTLSELALHATAHQPPLQPPCPTLAEPSNPTSNISEADAPIGETLSGRVTASPNKPKQKRATKSNPYNNHVQGVKRGNQEFQVVRGHALPKVLDGSDATDKFRRGIGPLMTKCEDLAVQTRSYIMLVAEHPLSSDGLIHYTSPRLRRDGGERLEQLLNRFDVLIRKIKEARTKEALELSMQLEDMRGRMRRVMEENERLKRGELEHVARERLASSHTGST